MVSSSKENFLELLSSISTDTGTLGSMREREDLAVALSACQSY